MAATISVEYMKKFLAELGKLFPEKKTFLGIWWCFLFVLHQKLGENDVWLSLKQREWQRALLC